MSGGQKSDQRRMQPLYKETGVYIFHFPPGGGGKNMKYWCMGKKYDDLLRRDANIRGKSWKNGKKGNFHFTLGKQYNFKKGEQKYPILGKYKPPGGGVAAGERMKTGCLGEEMKKKGKGEREQREKPLKNSSCIIYIHGQK